MPSNVATLGWQARTAAILNSRWLLAAGASVAIALAIWFRYFDLSHYGFNSDEAVYSGQAAALAGHQDYAKMFGVFRAHPLLVMFIVSLGFRVWGVDDVIPRLVTAGAGVLLVVVAGAVARVVHGRFAAVVAMFLMALSAYPITVSRQMLLDGPMALCFGISLFFMARYVRGQGKLDLAGAAAAAGLAFLSKETAILMAPAVIVFFLIARDLPFRINHVALWCAVYALTILPFPLSLMLSGGSGTTQQFFIWQLFRRPNHTPDFYLSIIPVVGIPIIVLAAVGVARALARRGAMDVLVLCSALVTIAFFQAWPVKGFQYLLPVMTPAVLLASDGLIGIGEFAAAVLSRLSFDARRPSIWAARGIGVGLACAMLWSGAANVLAAPAPLLLATDSDDTLTKPAIGFTAGTGGLAASRPTGDWIDKHTLPGARFITIGPSFANVIQWYGHRRAVALSVSPNPLRRNPTYEPVINPDQLLRTNAVQYLVYDSYTASRTEFFTAKLVSYVKKYHGVQVFSYAEDARRPDGTVGKAPVVLIYEVHP
ncbi:MAG TPA: glycosyltransferase family 39 protein [Candidatus Dormibacteraeota bacterium]